MGILYIYTINMGVLYNSMGIIYTIMVYYIQYELFYLKDDQNNNIELKTYILFKTS